jgi:hypothetical protein
MCTLAAGLSSMKRALILLALCIPSLALAQEPPNRMLGLVTQDQNGLFVVLVVATPSEVKASVRQISAGHSVEPEVSPYPRELFDELWLNARDLELSKFVATNVPDVGASKNYVITIGMDNKPNREMYSVPKCAAPPAVVLFVKRLAHDLLPAGSPGLFEPCPQSSDRSDG